MTYDSTINELISPDIQRITEFKPENLLSETPYSPQQCAQDLYNVVGVAFPTDRTTVFNAYLADRKSQIGENPQVRTAFDEFEGLVRNEFDKLTKLH